MQTQTQLPVNANAAKSTNIKLNTILEIYLHQTQ